MLSKAMKLQPKVVLCVHASKPGLAEGRREDIKEIWDNLKWEFAVFKTAQDVKAGEPQTALTVIKPKDTWGRLEQLMDMTNEEFAAAF